MGLVSWFCGNICMNAVKSEKMYFKTSREVILCVRSNEFIKLNGLELRSKRWVALGVWSWKCPF